MTELATAVPAATRTSTAVPPTAPVAPADEPHRLAVPPSLFIDHGPPFVLFDGRGRRADLLIARQVWVAPSDLGALDRWLRLRLPMLLASSRVTPKARAWGLHRALRSATAEALAAIPSHPAAVSPLIDALAVAAQYVWEQPPPYLAALAGGGEQAPAAHAVRTSMYALVLAAAAGIDRTAARAGVMLAAALADVGRWQSPLAAVRRPGPLSVEEWTMMRLHAERSAELLLHAGVGTTATVRAARHHHEWWDGGGYPARLAHDAIPLEARIVAIADAYAALTADRPHMAARPGYEALLEMARTTGQFDPGLLRLFITTLARIAPVEHEGLQPLDA